MGKMQKITVENIQISLMEIGDKDYISLTNMVEYHEDGSKLIEKWLTNKNTIEFLGIWEQLNNENFNSPEFGGIMQEAGTNRFYMSVKQWTKRTDAIGITARVGRNGGTYAHKDIAFNFGLYISPMFNLLLIKEYQKLKEQEKDAYGLEWDVRRVLSRANYHFHTDAVQKHIIPKSTLPLDKQGIEYAREADLLNLAVYGYTAKEWKLANKNHVAKGLNMRDFSSISELTVMANIESMNAEMIKLGGSKKDRFKLLNKVAKEQLEKLKGMDIIKSIRKQNSNTYIEAQEKTGEELEELANKSILEKNQEALSAFKKKEKDKAPVPLSDFNQKLKQGLEFNPKEENPKEEPKKRRPSAYSLKALRDLKKGKEDKSDE